MKRITWVRHAKSSWADEGLSDHERPLNKRGLRDAPEMGARLAARMHKPERILSSTALRASTTARIVAEAIGLDPDSIVREPRMYLASVEEMLEVVAEQPASCSDIMVFWHNPGITEAARMLVGIPVLNVPTCGVVCAEFATDNWSGVAETLGKEVFYDFPKNG